MPLGEPETKVYLPLIMLRERQLRLKAWEEIDVFLDLKVLG